MVDQALKIKYLSICTLIQRLYVELNRLYAYFPALCFQLVGKLTTDEDIQDVEFDCNSVSTGQSVELDCNSVCTGQEKMWTFSPQCELRSKCRI